MRDLPVVDFVVAIADICVFFIYLLIFLFEKRGL